MYKAEITTIINENIELGLAVNTLIKDFGQTSNIASLTRAKDIQQQIADNHRRIEKMRGDK